VLSKALIAAMHRCMQGIGHGLFAVLRIVALLTIKILLSTVISYRNLLYTIPRHFTVTYFLSLISVWFTLHGDGIV
jgi:hypothetical protein